MAIMMEGVLRMPYGMANADELSRLQFYSQVQEALGELQRLRAENETLKRDAEWISVEDRRPDEIHGNKVLAYGEEHVFENEYYDSDGEGNWCNIEGIAMTHWRPLPPPPDSTKKG